MFDKVLPAGWRWTTLGNIAAEGRSVVSGPFGSNIGSRFFVPAGVPVIRGNNLTTDHTRFIDDGFVFITEAKAEELKSCEAVPHDLVFTAAGSLGQLGLIPSSGQFPRYIISNKQMRVRVDTKTVEPLFAFYWFASPHMVAYVQQRNTGSSVPLINLNVLRSLPLPLPPLKEQRAIIQVLGSLDDKIESNRHVNETLDSIARAIFKSWFVDFDPVRKNAEQLQIGGQAALFPSTFQESEHGPIPNAWTVRTIGDVVRVIGGSTPSTENPTFWDSGTIYWATPKDLAKLSSPVLLDTERRITPEGLANISSGLLPAGTVLLSSRAPIGYLAVTEVPVAVNQGFIAMVCEGPLPNHFVRMWAQHNLDEIEARANGTTFLEISKTSFRPIPVLVPPAPVCIAFVRAVEPLHRRMVSNLKESDTLTKLRDTLLPKLLSGEVRLNQAERQVETAL
jgi:type I restriction enzyme S subunit